MSITILIVDDNEDIRFTLKEICAYAGWSVVEASTGKQAIELFKTIEPDLVLLDYHMPDWDGLKTTKELRKHNTRIPIIILTVDERQEIANTFLHAEATDFALKPIKAPDLISRIRINLKVGKLIGDKDNVYVEKGISQSTLNSIKSFLIQQDTPSSINEIQQSLPIAYQTVHRYLNYLESKGEVEAISQYGKQGRPKNKYKLV
ncbi:Response regulator of citrate/malate metabolism [Virgibacillus subterraneus]|uniref:Response regulator of citrate/malate metabolism n=2 Tax=Virgibacillus TaxID=84406 RepID=A0A1H0ZFY1_9BACI|nr:MULTISPECIES: response regulator [Virgibacillus]SDQ26294.1 Response regulator of citrate/malate metabolism [Virgibacillus salinus]SEP92357.1 Response regulator of citrate/malate metabolism [Virgibacillus subterraneus]